jgi:hypothetical protein
MRSLLLTPAIAIILLTLNPCLAAGQHPAEKPLRVLVDASKDGGLWWFPQGRGNTFDPRQPHQGKPLADFMRSKGWEVVELGRGEVITQDTLRDVDFVVRPPIYFDYTADEVVAYRDNVMGGMRLLLLGSSGTNDGLAAIFGLRFDSSNRFAAVRQWIPHPLSANIAGKDLPWTSVSESPPNAVQLAWLNQGQANSRPVLGYLPYGNGYVVFVGQAFISRDPDRSFFGSLIDSVAQYSLEEIKQVPMPAPVDAALPLERGPLLLTPVAGATLPQPGIGEWRFDWRDTPGAKAYEIVVLGSSAIFPMVNTITTRSSYVRQVSSGYIADHNLRGWSWRVRAQYGNGTWGPWSAIRRFNVTPRH